jgi:hypothetical protein
MIDNLFSDKTGDTTDNFFAINDDSMLITAGQFGGYNTDRQQGTAGILEQAIAILHRRIATFNSPKKAITMRLVSLSKAPGYTELLRFPFRQDVSKAQQTGPVWKQVWVM